MFNMNPVFNMEGCLIWGGVALFNTLNNIVLFCSTFVETKININLTFIFWLFKIFIVFVRIILYIIASQS